MKLKLVDVRLAFPSLFEPSSFAGSDDKSFQAAFIFPPNHPAKKLVEDACVTVAKEKWGAKWETVYKSLKTADKLAIHDGDTKEAYEGYEGNFFVNARNKARPTVRDLDGKTDLAAQDGKPYAGCFVVALIEIYAQDNAYGKRINATLRGVQFKRDGDAFSGSAPAGDDEFDDLESGEGNDDLM
jgi:hypothetical protein